MPANQREEDAPVLVEMTPRTSIQQVAVVDTQAAADLSAAALQHAMSTIRQIAERVVATLDQTENRPTGIEVSFGLKLTSEGQALVAKASEESTISVKLTWAPQPQ